MAATAIGDTEIVSVTEAAHGGACVGRLADGRVVFVRHTLPGETVRVRITQVKSSLAWADAFEVLESSPDRMDSIWPEAGAGGVGGAELAHVHPQAQRQWKTNVIAAVMRRVGGTAVEEQLQQIGGVCVEATPGDADPDDLLLGRRSRIELVADDRGHLGMRRFHDNAVIALSSMPLADDRILSLPVWGRSFYNVSKTEEKLWNPGERVRLVAPNDDEPVIVTERGVFDSDGASFRRPHLKWQLSIHDVSLKYRVRPRGFWQAHREGAQTLAQAVVDAAALRGGENILELYSGAGLFTVALAASAYHAGLQAPRILSCEGDEAAVADAHGNCESYEGVDAWIGFVDSSAVRDLSGQLTTRPDLVVLDPPRAGAKKDVSRAIAATGARKIILISCDPAAGARDIATFIESGYRLTQMRAWDLFPHTHHVEIMSVLVWE